MNIIISMFCVSVQDKVKIDDISQKKVMDYIGVAEIQSAHAKHIDEGVHEASQIRSKTREQQCLVDVTTW